MGQTPRWEGLYHNDKGGMLEALARFPEQCRQGMALGEGVEFGPLEGFSRVVALGMGGSGVGGDLLARVLPIEVVPIHGYTLPPWVGEESLLLALSYSGDTEETLTAFEEGLSRTRKALAVTSGGALGRLCGEQEIPWIRIPSGHQPRAALGYLLFPLLALFRGLGLLPYSLEAVLAVLDRQAHTLAPGNPDNPAQRLAQVFCGRVPLVYGSGPTAPVAFRWKTQVNENAEQPAFWAELPELCHNEIVGWGLAGRFLPQGTVVFLRTSADHPRVRLRVEILKGMLSQRNLPWFEVSGEGEDQLSQALSLLYLGDWVSVYLALLNGVDPTPVDVIRELKHRLGGGSPKP